MNASGGPGGISVGRFHARRNFMVRHLRSICGPTLILCCAIVSGSCMSEEPSDSATSSAIEDDRGDRAVSAVLRDQNRVAVATVVFTPTRGGTVVAVAARATAGIHGFHVHANNDPANGVGCIADPTQPPNTFFVSADGHYNPVAGATHGNHAGDMPPLFVGTNGSASSSFVTDRFTTADIRGRAVILHAGNDNLGNVPVGAAANQYTANAADATTLTANTGNAGNRIACGVIN
jgi:superoxide dismutase, Cu-Zn family